MGCDLPELDPDDGSTETSGAGTGDAEGTGGADTEDPDSGESGADDMNWFVSVRWRCHGVSLGVG